MLRKLTPKQTKKKRFQLLFSVEMLYELVLPITVERVVISTKKVRLQTSFLQFSSYTNE